MVLSMLHHAELHTVLVQHMSAVQVLLQLRRLKGPKKGNVYCVLACEGQTKRTSLAVGHQQPVWKEEVTFRAVQITSDLQVS